MINSVETVLDRPTTSVLPEVDITDPERHERFTHIVLEGWKPDEGDFISANNSVAAGAVLGTPIKALCGKVWVPKYDPKKYPLCPACKEIAHQQGWEVPAS